MKTQQLLLKHSFWLLCVSWMVTVIVTVLRCTMYPAKPTVYLLPVVLTMAILVDRVQSSWRSAEKSNAREQLQCFLRVYLAATAIVWSGAILAMIIADQNGMSHELKTFIRRMVGILFAISMMLFGNYLPKLSSPWRYADEPFDWQGVHRFAGMAFTVVGLVMALGWCFLSVDLAKRLTVVVVVASSIAVISRKWFSLATWRPKGSF
ncbi:MAG: hypothetical protein R3C03_19055 [Pirellulaceae bacterium]